jgi:hypothetical protein
VGHGALHRRRGPAASGSSSAAGPFRITHSVRRRSVGGRPRSRRRGGMRNGAGRWQSSGASPHSVGAAIAHPASPSTPRLSVIGRYAHSESAARARWRAWSADVGLGDQCRRDLPCRSSLSIELRAVASP